MGICWASEGSRGCGFGASPSGRVCAAGVAAVRPAVSPRPGGVNLRSSRDPSQRTTAHNAWKPSCGGSPSCVNLSAVFCMGYRERVRRVEEPVGLARLHDTGPDTMPAARRHNQADLGVRLAAPAHHREAMTTRPLLLSAIARQTQDAGQVTLTISSRHTARDKAHEAYGQARAPRSARRPAVAQVRPRDLIRRPHNQAAAMPKSAMVDGSGTVKHRTARRFRC